MQSVVTVEFFSAALGRTSTYTAIVPGVGVPPFAVLYLLHGHDDDHRAWLYKSRLLQHAATLPLLIVMPSGENSYYVGAHEELVARELPAEVARTFRVRAGRAAIGGLSMGGYGAIRLGLKYPATYGSVYAHSSRLPARAELPTLSWAASGGDDAQALDDLDVAVLASRAERATLPAFAFDCGQEDRLLPDNQRFDEHLRAIELTHRYREYPGAHDWDYWDAHVKEQLEHHARALGV